MTVPNPGSAEAQKQECTCPVIDNNYGEGVLVKGERVFWMTAECPLHGWENKNNRPYKMGQKAHDDGKNATSSRKSTAHRN